MSQAQNTEQPMPTPGRADVTESLIARIRARQRKGIETYGTTLQTFNGRNPIVDAIEEDIDRMQYLEQWLLEREELIEALCDVVNQACQVDYDHNDERMIVHHHCLAAYEDAFALLSKLGLLSNYDPTVRGYWLEWPSQRVQRSCDSCAYSLPVNADDTHASCDLGVGEATEAGCPRVEAS